MALDQYLNEQEVSLSVRRAWIEMSRIIIVMKSIKKSLSVRRAWIEMCLGLGLSWDIRVALRKESVDRNNDTSKKTQPGRSP